MALIRRSAGGAREVLDDRFALVGDGDPIGERDPIVSLERLRAEGEALRARGPVGLVLDGTADVEALASEIASVDLIAVRFPAFTDGRGYSVARLLRDRLGYRGPLRAIGNVLRDQVFYLARVGFDELELAPGRSVEEAIAALGELSVTYQPAADHDVPIWRRRATS
ncbi:MAG: DUF934 domain-containing protein [Sandaracinaceae bacterium]|nr:DUF934 domain-containing protein [Sandaracinaceae bacterium]